MTGHQENPGSGFTLQGEVSEIMDIETLVKAMGAKNVRTVNPMNLKEMKEAFDWAYSIENEPVVIITRWPCVLKKLSIADKEEFNVDKTVCEVDSEKCIGCKGCMKIGCPAIEFNKETKKASIDPVQCVGCTVCNQVCPKKAIDKKVGAK